MSFSRETVKNMFSENTRNIWINHLSGTLNHQHEVEMLIGTDGHILKGVYTLPHSKDVFLIEGKTRDNLVFLTEITEDYKVTGIIEGEYDGFEFNGSWSNLSKDISYPLKLSSKDNPKYKTDWECDNNYWVGIYSGRMSNQSVGIKIHRDDTQFRVVANSDNMIQQVTLKCNDTLQNLLQPQFLCPSLTDKGILLCSNDPTKVFVVSIDGRDTLCSLFQNYGLNYSCFDYADYHSLVSIQKPETVNAKFNKWIESKISKWKHNKISHIKETHNREFGTYDRWIQTIDGWVEIDFYTGDYISGTLYLHSSLSPKTHKTSFIFNLKQGKENSLESLFVSTFDNKSYFKQVIENKKQTGTWSDSERNWVQSQKFDYVTLKDTGISFKTDFSSIYGEKEILVPYNEIRDNFKNKNFIKSFFPD